ncbi:MAG: hypothetical protein K6E60_03245 [Saccharofermentans sp.]|nr:hypothetical protein [Saccharofermentans sp.]
MNINGKTIAAYILLLIEIAVFFISGYAVARNDARHHAKLPQIPEGMLLTVIKDTDCIYGDDTVHLSEGTAVIPYSISMILIHRVDNTSTYGVYFYYSENKEDFERFKRLNSLDKLSMAKEMGVMSLNAGFDCFAEQKQLEQIIIEAENTTRLMTRSAFWEDFTPVIAFGLCFSAAGFFFTRLLVKKQWYVLLFVVDIVVMGVVYFSFGLFLYH